MITIAASQLFDGTAMRGAWLVDIADGRIMAVRERAGRPADVTLADDVILAPGFIDVQVNGGGGVLLNDDPTLAGIETIVAAHRRFGTTGLLPTLITDAPKQLDRLNAVAARALSLPGVLGFHLEGPHLNPLRKGIHPSEWIRPPSPHDRAMLAGFGAMGRSVVTLAPECVDASVITEFAESGLRVCVGHSDASADVIAATGGLAGVTHLFNAMSQITPRAPGVVGAALTDDRLFVGIIADGVHVDPRNLRLAFRVKGRDRLMLVTDAMASLGSPNGSFMLQGRRISLQDGRLTDEHGTLAGAHLSMIEAVGNAVRMIGASLEDALVMASLTPARFLGLDDARGRIAPGYHADLVAFDKTFQVHRTWIGGV